MNESENPTGESIPGSNSKAQSVGTTPRLPQQCSPSSRHHGALSNNMTSVGMLVDTSAEDGWYKIADASVFDGPGETKRVHACIERRYVSVIEYKGTLYCIDSICFHAGGPLALGDIEDINHGKNPCLVCPWHFYHVSLADGEKWYQAADVQPDGTLKAGSWQSVGVRQRKHSVERRDDGVYVKLCDVDSSAPLESDKYASEHETGERIMQHGEVDSNAQNTLLQPWSNSKGSTPPASPRRSMMSSESEDVWPEDLDCTTSSAKSSPRRTSKKK